jgi:hypothetical protein
MMRIWLLVLMIALLPVRGWLGNAMAVDMASQAVAKAQKAGSPVPANVVIDAEASMPADCPMHAQSADTAAAAIDAEAGSVHCNACDTCELCLALATSTWSDAATLAFAPHAAPLATGYRFTSADRFSSFKPPIS